MVSEVNYLSKMNKWHKMSNTYKKMNTIDEKIEFGIKGSPKADKNMFYPDIFERLSVFTEWLKQDNVINVKYEDLVNSNKKHNTIDKMFTFYKNKSYNRVDKNKLINKALLNIDPYNSHTFNEEKTGKWAECFSDKNKKLFKEYAGKLLIDLEYEYDSN